MEMEICKQQSETNTWLCGRKTYLSVMGVRVGVANFFSGQSREASTFQLKFFSSIKIVGATDLGGLWALEWARHIRVTNLRCVQDY